MNNQSILILTFLLLLNSNAFALVASDVDMTQAISDVSVIVLVVINISLVLMGSRKVLSMFGR